MLASIQSHTATACHSILKYTPFVPAVRQINNQWEVDHSLLTKRAYIIGTIALAVFVTSMAFEVLSIGTIAGFVLLAMHSGADEHFAGIGNARKCVFNRQLELLKNENTTLENVNLSFLVNNHQSLSDGEFTAIFNALESLRLTKQENWLDKIVTNLPLCEAVTSLSFFERSNDLGLFNKKLFINICEKIHLQQPHSIREQLFTDLIQISDFPLSLEEERALFISTDLVSFSCRTILFCYLQKDWSKTPEFIARHFAYIVKTHPENARSFLYILAGMYMKQSSSAPSLQTLMKEFNRLNSSHPLAEKFRQTCELLNQASYNTSAFKGILFPCSQAQARVWLAKPENERSPDRARMQLRAAFNDAFDPILEA